MLDLFSGTASVSRTFREAGWETTSLDRDLPADIRADVLEWDFREFQPGHFDFVWASPPCTEYSKAKTTGRRDLATANRIVERTLEIIEFLQPQAWILENPQTGLLKAQDFMKQLDYRDVDYCMYGFDYRKRTRLWGNLLWEPRPLCGGGGCGKVREGRHPQTAQKAGKRDWGQRNHRSQELYSVPPRLVQDIADAAARAAQDPPADSST